MKESIDRHHTQLDNEVLRNVIHERFRFPQTGEQENSFSAG